MLCKRAKHLVPNHIFKVKLLGDIPQSHPVVSLNQAREPDNDSSLFPAWSVSRLTQGLPDQGSLSNTSGAKDKK